MKAICPHDRLVVYGKALAFVQLMSPQIELWPRTHAVRDQMDRACESVILNLVRATWHQRCDQGIYLLECSIGSVLECAACLDIARIKGLLETAAVDSAKLALVEITRMQVGLRRSWMPAVHEDVSGYGDQTCLFPHETLQLYQRALELCRLLTVGVLAVSLPQLRYARRIDEASTSMLLNIAEGNGRFSRLDHRQFIANAEESGVRLAAYLDLIEPACPTTIVPSKALLREVMAMLGGMNEYLESK